MKKTLFTLLVLAILIFSCSFARADGLTDYSDADIRIIDTISRSKPVFIGQTAMFSQTANDNIILMTITDVTRGTKANGIIKKANMFNDKPASGQEYVIVTFKIDVVSTSDDSSSISMYGFDFVSREGAVYKSSTPAGLDSSVQLYGGGSDTLQVSSIVDKKDTPYVVYLDGVWFDLDTDKAVTIRSYEALKKGDANQAVQDMKERMQELGYYTKGSTITNKYNDSCAERIKLFQKVNGLTQTGTADTETLKLLYSNDAKANPNPF